MANVDANKVEISSGKGNKKKCSRSERIRFNLFDLSCKTDLAKAFSGGLIDLVLEGGGSGKGNREHDDDNKEGGDKTVSLNLDEGSSSEEEGLEELPLDDNQQAKPTTPKKGKGHFCGTCNVTFTDLTEQRLHYTLDWHRYNIKRKLHGQGPVVETKFDEMIDDLSSIDGSDEEDEETTGDNIIRLVDKLEVESSPTLKSPVRLKTSEKVEKSPKVHFTNSHGQVITCYKTILMKETGDFNNENFKTLLTPNQDLPTLLENPLKITIIMASGGHFAAAVFDGNTCTVHKTFHSYTIRAKQGGSQGARDKKGNVQNCKSAGASLRRYNEQSFSQHVQDLLESWKDHITNSDFIFYRAISSNSSILFTGKNPPLKRDSLNLKTIPFVTKRPTFSEVKRVHSLLTTVHVYETTDAFLSAHSHFKKNLNKNSPNNKPKKTIDRAKSRSPKRRNSLENQLEVQSSDENENLNLEIEMVDTVVDFSNLKEFDDTLTDEQRKGSRSNKKKNKKQKSEQFKLTGPLVELCDLISQGDSNKFQSLLQSSRENDNEFDVNQPITAQGSTLLHAAAEKNCLDIVWSLLEIGCNPAIKDKNGKYPYNCAESRECREMFRKFMGQFPDKYDYKTAQVPPPLSEEMEKERAEKKKLMNKLKREKEKQKKAERYEKDKEMEEQKRFLNLSDREKRALAAEQRILAQCRRNSEKVPVLIRCFECACDITGKVPFEYSQNVFCTTKCLAAHRKKFPAPLPV